MFQTKHFKQFLGIGSKRAIKKMPMPQTSAGFNVVNLRISDSTTAIAYSSSRIHSSFTPLNHGCHVVPPCLSD